MITKRVSLKVKCMCEKSEKEKLEIAKLDKTFRDYVRDNRTKIEEIIKSLP